MPSQSAPIYHKEYQMKECSEDQLAFYQSSNSLLKTLNAAPVCNLRSVIRSIRALTEA